MERLAASLFNLLALSIWLSGCAAHCDRSPNNPCECFKLEKTALPGRNGSSVKRLYEAAVFGNSSDAPVLLLHDMNGASWNCLQLGREIAQWGHRVYVPNLFAGEGMKLGSKDFLAANRYLKKNPDWQVDKLRDSGAIIEDIACMVREIARRHTGQKMVVIGNCLTGIFPLGLLHETSVSRVVLCQPATPLMNTFQIMTRTGQFPYQERAFGLSDAVIERSLEAMSRDEEKKISVFHYAHDPIAPMGRVTALYQRLTQRGLAGRMKTYVLMRPGDDSLSWWTKTGFTCVPKGWTTPHSTLVNAGCTSDLRWFRSHLKHILTQ